MYPWVAKLIFMYSGWVLENQHLLFFSYILVLSLLGQQRRTAPPLLPEVLGTTANSDTLGHSDCPGVGVGVT